MVIKMRCNDITVLIIRRMLHRCEFFNLYPHRKNNDSSRVLTGCPSDTGTTLYDTVDLTVTFMLSALLIIVLYVTERSLFCKSTNCSGFKCLAFSEDNLRITMRIRLIFTREVKVNIRLFISFKSKERFKRNIKSFFIHLCPTLRAYFIRHIASGHTTEFFNFRRIKITVFTFRTQIMRWQRIYLCDTGHSRRK